MSEKKIMFLGDINLMGVHDPELPFENVTEYLQSADAIFTNLECCLYDCDIVYNEINSQFRYEGLYAETKMVEALKKIGVTGVGTANNVNFGVDAILSSCKCLKENEILNTGSGKNIVRAIKPIEIERDDLKIGMVQRTCVYWPVNHEARLRMPGVAVLKVHTAYRPVFDGRAVEKPGMLPEVLTWADPNYLESYLDQIKKMKEKDDIVIASMHWGLEGQIVSYQTEIAHALIDAGADIVIGHGTHKCSGMEIYKGKAIFYSIGHFYFNIGHCATDPGAWIGLMPIITVEDKKINSVKFSFVRRTKEYKTILVSPDSLPDKLKELEDISATFNTVLKADGDLVELCFN